MLFSETLPFNPQKLIFRYLEIIPFHFLVNSSKEPDIDFEPFLVELSLKKICCRWYPRSTNTPLDRVLSLIQWGFCFFRYIYHETSNSRGPLTFTVNFFCRIRSEKFWKTRRKPFEVVKSKLNSHAYCAHRILKV